MTNNGCNEDGWDLYEEQTRTEFDCYVVHRGYDITKDLDHHWMYADKRTEEAWTIYIHVLRRLGLGGFEK